MEEVVDDDGFTFKRRLKGGGAVRRRGGEGEEDREEAVYGKKTAVVGAGVEQPPPRPGAELLYHVTKAMPDLHKSIPASWCVFLIHAQKKKKETQRWHAGEEQQQQ